MAAHALNQYGVLPLPSRQPPDNEERLSIVEYINYILIILAILLSCFLMVRVPEQPRRRPTRANELTRPGQVNRGSTRVGTANNKPEAAQPKLQRQSLEVPTPWGWPGHHGPAPARKVTSLNAQEVHGVSESLHHFVDRLFQEKHTVEDREYLLRKNASLRALVEDRYGKASSLQDVLNPQANGARTRGAVGSEDRPRTVSAGGQNGEASSGEGQPYVGGAALRHAAGLRISRELKDIRKPWGW